MSKKSPRLLIVSGYHAQSHAYWAEQLIKGLTAYHVELISLPARYYSWRMGGNALSLMSEFDDVLRQSFDVVLLTSMVDVSSLLGLYPHLSMAHTVLYCHENQFEYPNHIQLDKGNQQLQQSNRVNAQMRSIYSALAVDDIVFNSDFNRQTFLQGAQQLLKKMPDFTLNVKPLLQAKASCIGIPLAEDVMSSQMLLPKVIHSQKRLRIAWVARWEFDKGLVQLLAIADILADKNIELEWVLLGQQFRKIPEAGEIFLRRYKSSIRHSGFVESREQYLEYLRSCDVILSTSLHEFYGIAVLEAVACGCWPILPKQQVYPEMYAQKHLYDGVKDAAIQLEMIYHNGLNDTVSLQGQYFSQQVILQQYQQLISKIVYE